MQLLYLDFETHYRKDFDLKSAKSSGQYIDTTQLQMLGWAINDNPVQLAIGEKEIRQVLDNIDASQVAVVSHNGLFDCRLLKNRFNFIPKFYFDTLAMMRATQWNQVFGGASLGHLSKVLQSIGLSIEDKGSEVADAKGKYLYQFSNGVWYMHEQEITREYLETMNLTRSGKKKAGKAFKNPRYVIESAIQFVKDFGEYCINDVEICRAGFKEMVKLLPKHELHYQHMILSCSLNPQLEMDVPMLKQALHKAQTELRKACSTIGDKWFNGDYQAGKDALLSPGKLAIVLKAMGAMTQEEIDEHVDRHGYEPEVPFIIPVKISEKKTAKAGYPVYEYALAKKDPEFVELMKNPYQDLQEIIACRKTAIYYNNYEIPRLQRFINEQEWAGEIGIPLKVSGAFTHRLGGDLFNIQNLSSGRNEGQDATMRNAIMAKAGNVVVAADSSQIEARVLAFEANETIILDEFKNGVDPYCALAEKIYGIPYDVINKRRKDEEDPLHEEAKLQRQAGKAGRLGLGYQMGARAFVDYAATLGVTLSFEESQRVVNIYRTTYAKTSQFWNTCGEVLNQLVAGGQGYFGGLDGKLFYFDGARVLGGRRAPGIRLPDGMWLTYMDLQVRERTYPDGSKKWNFCYYGFNEGKPGWVWVYSGKVAENLTQALAFAIMKWQAMNINMRYPIAFNVHDEWITSTTAADAEQCKEFVENEMRRLPEWAMGCPIDAEGAYAVRYGEC